MCIVLPYNRTLLELVCALQLYSGPHKQCNIMPNTLRRDIRMMALPSQRPNNSYYHHERWVNTNFNSVEAHVRKQLPPREGPLNGERMKTRKLFILGVSNEIPPFFRVFDYQCACELKYPLPTRPRPIHVVGEPAMSNISPSRPILLEPPSTRTPLFRPR